jgi:hypothetical protein
VLSRNIAVSFRPSRFEGYGTLGPVRTATICPYIFGVSIRGDKAIYKQQ